MSVIIKPLKNVKKISKVFSKDLKKLLKVKPNARIGIDLNQYTQEVLDLVKKNKKIDWYNSKIFSLAEYKERQLHPIEETLNKEFVDSINVYKNNVENMQERIERLNQEDKLEHLYNFEGGIDLLVFSIDARGNFAFNDYESKVSLLNFANNGTDIVSPGIASILLARKIICFVIDESATKTIDTLNNKSIEEDDVLTYLQLHSDVTVYTLTSVINKKDVNKEVSIQNYSEFRKEVIEAQNALKQRLLEEKPEPKDSKLFEEEKESNLETDLDNNLYNKSNLDEELENTLQENKLIEEEENLQQSLFDQNSNPEDLVNDDQESLDNAVKEALNKENEDLLNELENKLSLENNEDKLVEEEVPTEEEPTEEEFDELPVVEDIEVNTEDDIEPQIDVTYDDVLDVEPDEKVLVLSSDEVENVIDYKEATPESTDQESEIINQLISEGLKDDSKEKQSDVIEDLPIDKLLTDEPQVEVSDIEDLKLDDVKPEDLLVDPNPTETKQKVKELTDNYEPTTQEEIARYIMIKSDALKSIENLILVNRLQKLKDEVYLANLKEQEDIEEANRDKSLPPYLRLEYVPGDRPTPMLMLYEKPDYFEYETIFKDTKKEYGLSLPIKKFNTSNHHIFNIGAYFSFNEKNNEIDLLAFRDFDKLVYLFRHLNKPLYFYLKKKDYLKIKPLIKELNGELKVVA